MQKCHSKQASANITPRAHHPKPLMRRPHFSGAQLMWSLATSGKIRWATTKMTTSIVIVSLSHSQAGRRRISADYHITYNAATARSATENSVLTKNPTQLPVPSLFAPVQTNGIPKNTLPKNLNKQGRIRVGIKNCKGSVKGKKEHARFMIPS